MHARLHYSIVAATALACAAHARAATDERPDPSGALLEEATQTASAIREMIIFGVADGRHESIYIEFGVSVTQGTLVSANERGIGVATRTATISVPWKRVKPRRLYFIGKTYMPPDDAFIRLLLGRYCVAHGLDKEAKEELSHAVSLDATLEDQAKQSLAVIAERETKRRAPTRAKASGPKKKKRRALPVTGKTAEVLAKLGRSHFMLGVTQGTHSKWVKETREQGCRWDMRYQYLAGGINTERPWRAVNRPDGQYALNYLKISDQQGVVPVITWYEMRQSLPGGSIGNEGDANKTNCENVDTMRTYLGDVKFFMEVAAKYGKPVIFHVEPDLTGFFLTWNQFKPHDPNQITVRVKSTGLPDVQDYPDSLTGFFQAIIHLRDTYGPNVLLAYHASLWGGPPPLKRIADLINSGRGGGAGWDLVFVDPSDRDAAWKIANKYALHDTWWDDKRFENWRAWSAQLHGMTGLPMMAWQIPTGNTIMAACNNTQGHYMDNRPEYWLEDYPKNTHLLEWAQAGYIGLLFGRGAGGNTHFGDAENDGVTNPEPIEGNRGEKSNFPDDDGGYLRMRGARYYRAPLMFDIRLPKKKARSRR